MYFLETLGPEKGKWISLFFAWLAMMMTGTTFSLNLYSNAIKEIFNFTQTEGGLEFYIHLSKLML